MTIELSSQKSECLYKKAFEACWLCIYHKENAFLKEEISILPEQIQLKESSVKVIFSKNSSKIHCWEVNIDLWNESSCIGKYTYIEDKDGSFLDDSLTFFSV